MEKRRTLKQLSQALDDHQYTRSVESFWNSTQLQVFFSNFLEISKKILFVETSIQWSILESWLQKWSEQRLLRCKKCSLIVMLTFNVGQADSIVELEKIFLCLCYAKQFDV